MSEPSNAGIADRYQGVRLRHFHVEKLFEEFSYSIPMRLDQRVTAIVAPNGAGKTLCLRLINALFAQKWSVFLGNKFTYISYDFTDGTRVRVDQRQIAAQEERSRKQNATVTITITGDDTRPEQWTVNTVDTRRSGDSLVRYLPFLTRVGTDLWTHDITGDPYTLSDVLEQFGDQLPEHYKEQWYGKVPGHLRQLVKAIDCHLIETQRLLILRDDEDEPPYYQRARRPPSTLAISRKAQKLKEIIAADFGKYASLSQSLDRSFPRRVINNPNKEPYSDLKERLQDLDRRRTELMIAGILDSENDEPVALPEGRALDAAMATILSIYAEDNDQKLLSLSGLLRKITLLKELIDNRLVTKEIVINKTSGIEVYHKKRKVPIEALSSGEQHQLVLFFELLFEIKSNALILIDEPELSLHVAWQKKFIGDLMKIIDLNKFDVILATHSPQLISRWTDLVVELGNIYDNESGKLRADAE